MVGPLFAREVRRHELIVAQELAGLRLDQALARALPEYSRSRLRRWIDTEKVRVDGVVRRARDPVAGGERIELEAVLEPVGEDRAEAIPLDVVHADAALIIINKPAGLVVHPGAGNRSGTLVNALLHYAPELARLPRAGLVHRLDKDTTGLLVVARTPAAHAALVAALARREIGRRYRALVRGRVTGGRSIDAPIGRHPGVRTRMAVIQRGRPALTHTRIAERLGEFTLLDVWLETGRTHQIRVHLAHVGTPVVGDSVYGGRRVLPPGLGLEARSVVQAFRRQALHAAQLELVHPASGATLSFEAPLPADFSRLLDCLRTVGR